MKPSFGNLKQSTFDSNRRQEYVTDMFDNLAPNYDRFNRWVSFYRDEAWRSQTVSLLKQQKNGTILDLAAGTGDLANSCHRAGAKQVHVFDISHNMLTVAKQKLMATDAKNSFMFAQGSAHKLPFKDETFNGVVSGFAMRNVFHFLDEVLLEIHRTLKPHGRFAILELTQPKNPILNFGFRLHMKIIMPLIGKMTVGKTRPFNYLRQTTLTFLSPEEFKLRIEKSGFINVGWKTFLLGGIAVHYGEKP